MIELRMRGLNDADAAQVYKLFPAPPLARAPGRVLLNPTASLDIAAVRALCGAAFRARDGAWVPA